MKKSPERPARRLFAAIGITSCLVILLCLSRDGASAARPAREPAPQASSMVEHVRGEMVLVEVHVTDPKGRPVPDLTLADFILHVDGSPRSQPLSTIEYLGAPPPAGGATGQEGAGPAEASAADAGGPPGRHFVIFFEDANSQPTNMTAARLAVEKFLARPGSPDDAIAVAAYNGRTGLRILHDFTSDRAALIQVVHASLRDTSRYSDLESITPSLMVQADEAAQEDYHYQSQVLAALGSLSDGLASWPGYKAIVYMGDGIPVNAGSCSCRSGERPHHASSRR